MPYSFNINQDSARRTPLELGEVIPTGVFNILNFIPAGEHAAIRARTSTYDCSSAINTAISKSPTYAQGELIFPSGLYNISQPIVLTRGLALRLETKAEIKAISAMPYLVSTQRNLYSQWAKDLTNSYISGGILNCNTLADVGVQVYCERVFTLKDFLITGAKVKGVEVGVPASGVASFQCNILNVQIIFSSAQAAPVGSIGLHYSLCTDSNASCVDIVGGETGVRADNGSIAFHMVHPWTRPEHGAMIYGFYCNGYDNKYSQCYADTPVNGSNPCYGFYVTANYNRFSDCTVYCNNLVGVDNALTGLYITPNARNCTVNGFFCNGSDVTHRIAKDVDGDLSKATLNGIYSNTYVVSSLPTPQKVSASTVDNQTVLQTQKIAATATYSTLTQQDAGNGALLLIDPIPGTATDQAQIRLFRNTNTSGFNAVYIFRGDGTSTVQHQLAANGDSFLSSASGKVGIGTNNPQTKFHVVGDFLLNGKTTTTPTPTATLTATSAISNSNTVVEVNAASAVTLTSTPTISTTGATNGQQLTILNTGANAITLQDAGTLVNSGLSLGSSTVAISPGTSRQFIYSTTMSRWTLVQ